MFADMHITQLTAAWCVMAKGLFNWYARRVLASAVCATAFVGAQAALQNASAAVVLNSSFSGERQTGTSFSVDFSSAETNAKISLQIQGYRTLDAYAPTYACGNGIDTPFGFGCYQDDFHLSLNGVEILSGTFMMGSPTDSVPVYNVLYTAPTGTTFENINYPWVGGYTDFVDVPITLLAGLNTLVFSYTSRTFFYEGLGNEAWGVNAVRVETYAENSVPIPGTVALLGLGLVGIGAARRNPKQRGV